MKTKKPKKVVKSFDNLSSATTEDVPKPVQPGTLPPTTPIDPDNPKKILA